MTGPTRRTFLASTAASAAQVPGANERVRAAVVGTGGRGMLHVETFKELGAQVAAVCDVYEPNLERGLKAASPGAKPYTDHRALLDDKSLDAVVIATPDHSHAAIAIDAVNAGKDVYIEKPLAHTIEEGFRIIDAVRRNKRIAQVGVQRRSSELFQQGRELARSGALGNIHLVNSQWLNFQQSLRSGELKGKLDWNRWLGSAPKKALEPARFLNWYYFWDYSGGMLIGQGAHIIDVIQWYMNSTFPSAVTCSATGPHVEGAEAPETASMSVEFPEGYLAVFTLGYRAMRYNWTNDHMTQFHGTKARFDLGREGYSLWPASSAVDPKASAEARKLGSFNLATVAHVRNFLECVRSRNEPNAPVEAGQHTNVALCMAMESLRTGRRVRYNASRRTMEA
jgi:predicted dehydrogenase